MINQYLILSAITLLAYFIKGITGFGNTLVMNSLFAFLKENRFTTPVDLLLGIPANLYLAWKNRQSIDWKVVLPLATAVVLGNIPGILLLRAGSDHLLKVLLGVVLIFLSVDMFGVSSRKAPASGGLKTGPAAGVWFIGLISGVLMGLYGIGALLATYLARHTDNRRDYRANLCFVFVIDNLFRFCGYGFQGIFNRQVCLFSLLLIPAAAAGLFLSVKADVRISENAVKKLVLVLLAISGLLLILNNISAL